MPKKVSVCNTTFSQTEINYESEGVPFDQIKKSHIIDLSGENKRNQSRICGKGVGLSLFPSDSLSFESYEQFVRKSKKSKNDCFFAIFGLNLAMFLTSQPYEFNEIAHKGP